jgi:O-succinylbenzoate synthase
MSTRKFMSQPGLRQLAAIAQETEPTTNPHLHTLQYRSTVIRIGVKNER